MTFILFGLVIGVSVLIAITDFCYFRIPNLFIGLLIFLYFLSNLWFDNFSFYKNLLPFFIFFTIFLLFYHCNWLGGGDAKLIPVCILWLGIQKLMVFSVLLLVFGVLLIGWISVHKHSFYKLSHTLRQTLEKSYYIRKIVSYLITDSASIKEEVEDYEQRRILPYGVVISASFLLALWPEITKEPNIEQSSKVSLKDKFSLSLSTSKVIPSCILFRHACYEGICDDF